MPTRRRRQQLGAAAAGAVLAIITVATTSVAETPASSPSSSATPSAPATPSASALGGPGESCRARSDCRQGLLCRAKACVFEHEGESCEATSQCGEGLKCMQNVCTNPAALPGGPQGLAMGGPAPGTLPGPGGALPPNANVLASGPTSSAFKGNHFFAGTVFLGGPALVAGGGGNEGMDSGFLWALRMGGYFRRTELALELSPKTYHPFGFVGTAFQMNGTIGYMALIVEGPNVSVYWPLRFGLGTVLGDKTGLAYIVARADMLGVAVKVWHAVIDLHMPSFRFANAPSVGLHVLSWDFGAGVSFVM